MLKLHNFCTRSVHYRVFTLCTFLIHLEKVICNDFKVWSFFSCKLSLKKHAEKLFALYGALFKLLYFDFVDPIKVLIIKCSTLRRQIIWISLLIVIWYHIAAIWSVCVFKKTIGAGHLSLYFLRPGWPLRALQFLLLFIACSSAVHKMSCQTLFWLGLLLFPCLFGIWYRPLSKPQKKPTKQFFGKNSNQTMM